jgi:hypothetical protein
LASGTLYLVVFLGLFVLEFVGLLKLHFEEHAAGANITTGGDDVHSALQEVERLLAEQQRATAALRGGLAALSQRDSPAA